MNIVVVHQPPGDHQGKAYPRSPERHSRQVVEAGSDHSNGVVSRDRHFPENMSAVAPTPGGSLCHQVQPQTSPICKPSTRPQGLGGGCTKSPMGGPGPVCHPTHSPIGVMMAKLRNYTCRRIILITPGWPKMPWFWDLVEMPATVPLCLPLVPDLLTQPLNGSPHENLENLNLHVWLLEPPQLDGRDSLRQWQHELRLLYQTKWTVFV